MHSTFPKAFCTGPCLGAIGWASVGPLKRVEGNLIAAGYQDQILSDLNETCEVIARRGHP